MPFARICYEPLAATQHAAVSALGGSLALSNEDHAGVTSERVLFFRLSSEGASAALPTVAEAARAYLQHWIALHELGDLLRLPSLDVVPVTAAVPPAFATAFSSAPGIGSSPDASATRPSTPAAAFGSRTPSPPKRRSSNSREHIEIEALVSSLWQFSTAVALNQRAVSAAFFDGSLELLDSLDRSVRGSLFSPVTDPFWAYLNGLLGESAAAALRDLQRAQPCDAV